MTPREAWYRKVAADAGAEARDSCKEALKACYYSGYPYWEGRTYDAARLAAHFARMAQTELWETPEGLVVWHSR